MFEDEDETEDRAPPSAHSVAQRACILSAVVCRGFIEKGPTDDGASLTDRIENWLGGLDLFTVMGPEEKAIIECPIGKLEKEREIQATWRVEGLAVLAWALGRFQFSIHDEQVDPYAVAESLDFLGDEAATFIESAELRSAESLSAAREFFYNIHCRIRGFLRGHRIYSDITAWFDPGQLQLLSVEKERLFADSDLSVRGTRIDKADRDVVQTCESIINERHRAAIWLIGEYPIYWDFPVDT